MGMSESVNLPSGMLESLGKYKEALKETKREMRELEREARRMQKGGGTVSREVAGKLEATRGTRARLEDAIIADKVARRGSGMGTATSMAVGGVGGVGGSLGTSAFLSKSRTILDTAQKLGGIGGMNFAARQLIKGVRTAGKAASIFSHISPRMQSANEAKKIKKYMTIRNALPKKASLERSLMNQKAAKVGFKHTGLSIAEAVGSMKSSFLRFAGGVGIYTAAGAAVYAYRSGTIAVDQARAESMIGTQKMFLDSFSKSAYGGSLHKNMEYVKGISEARGKRAAAKFLKASFYRNFKSALLGGDKEAIALEDKVTQSTLQRNLMGIKYGKRFSEQMSGEWIEKNMKATYKQKMWEKMGFQNKLFNNIAWYFGDDTFRDYYIFSDGIQNTDSEVKEEIRTEREAKFDKDVEEAKAKFNNMYETDRALQRSDAHQRTLAITSFQQDRLQRSLTW